MSICPNCGFNPQEEPYCMEPTHCPKCGYDNDLSIARLKELYYNMLNHISELVSGVDLMNTLRAIGFTHKEIVDAGVGSFVCVGNNRLEAYGSHMNFEMGFENSEVRVLITFEEFCKELDKGYGNSKYVQIARLYEDNDGKIWYDNEYVS